MSRFLFSLLFCIIFFMGTGVPLVAQNLSTITAKDTFLFANYDLFVDSTGKADLEDVVQLPDQAFLQLPPLEKLTKPGLHYWLRFKVRNPSNKALVLETPREFRISELYVSQGGLYHKSVFDVYRLWGENEYIFNNPSFALPGTIPDEYFYLHVSSDVQTGLGFLLMQTEFAHNKAVKTFTQIFLVSGILILAIIYTLVFLIRLRDWAFFYYLLYLVFLLLFMLTQVGATLPLVSHFKFHYYFLTIPYAGITISLLLYVDQTLFLKRHVPRFHRFIYTIIAIRILILFVAIAWNIDALNQSYVDYICLFPGYIATLVSMRKKFPYARLLFISLTILIAAYTIRTLFKTYISISYFGQGQNNDPLFYLFSILEVILLSFTLTQRYLFLRQEKEQGHRQIIQYQQKMLAESREKEQLKETLNKELETLVTYRTEELQQANEQLREQAKIIDEINKMLQEDNGKLSQQLVLVNKARLMENNMSFEEFSTLFPDDDKCQSFVGGLKWQLGYTCRKCGYKKFYEGSKPHSRQCKLCRYLESATANTLFENVKFSLQKALYILYYAYTTPIPNIHKLSQEIAVREGTCHNFYKKTEQRLQKVKPSIKSTMNWTQFILEMPEKNQKSNANGS